MKTPRAFILTLTVTSKASQPLGEALDGLEAALERLGLRSGGHSTWKVEGLQHYEPIARYRRRKKKSKRKKAASK